MLAQSLSLDTQLFFDIGLLSRVRPWYSFENTDEDDVTRLECQYLRSTNRDAVR